MRFSRSLVGSITLLPLLVSLIWNHAAGQPPTHNSPSAVSDPVVEPAAYDAGPVVVNRTASGVIRLINSDATPFAVTALVSDNGLFSIEIEGGLPRTVAPEDTAVITITFAPTQEGIASGTLRVLTDNPDHTPPTVPLTGVGIALRLGMDQSIDFGYVLRGRCEDSTLVVTNESPLPTRITRITIEEQGETNFFIVDSPDLPLELPAGASFEIGLRCCPTSLTARNTGRLIVEQADGENTEAEMSGRARGPYAGFSDNDGYNVGEVLLGVCRDTIVWLRNGEFVDIVLDTIELRRRWGSGNARIASPGTFPRSIPARDSIQVHIEYCPSDEQFDGWWMSAEFRSGSTKRVVLLGRGIQPLLWIDSASIVAGDLGEITLRVQPPMALDGTTGEIELFLNPNALWIERAERTDSLDEQTPIMIDRQRSGRVLISAPTPLRADSEGRFLRLSIRGLLTGEPVNTIEIRQIGFGDPRIGWNRVAGLVRLSGCDVSNFSGASRSVSIRSIQPNPAPGNQTTLVFRAPKGYRPQLVLYDTRGNSVLDLLLPEGTGEIEEYLLDLSSVPSGFYILELIDREERRTQTLRVE